MTRLTLVLLFCVYLQGNIFLVVNGFSTPCQLSKIKRKASVSSSFDVHNNRNEKSLNKVSSSSSLVVTEAAASSSASASSSSDDDDDTKSIMRKEGGLFSMKTKYGFLNLYGIWYGLVSIGLGIFWFLGLACCQLMYFFSRNKLDQKKRIPTFITHAWGVTLMKLCWTYPKMENLDMLRDFYKQKRAAMFVANHASWQDIPFLGGTIGWRNYKIIAKKELLKVPILSRGISVGGHIIVDRSNRRDQLNALKKGIAYLKNNVNLCTFPEGTRTKTGRMLPFKSGAFKMASKAEAPIIPIAIVNSGKCHPPHWMFPCKAGHKIAKVVICDPIETKDKSEPQVEEEVRNAIINALPEDQRPLEKK